MTLAELIVQALAPLVPAATHPAGPAVYALRLPMANGPPAMPAIRYFFVSEVGPVDICGAGDGLTDDVRTQVDVWHSTFDEARALRLQVRAAMQALPVPTVFAGGGDDFDDDLQLWRCRLDFISYASS